MPRSKATGRSAASIALGLAGLLLVSGCADSGDARILRLEASADSTILKMSVAACVDRYAVETAQDTSEIRVRVTAYPEGDAGGSCGIGVLVQLREPLGTRKVIDASTGDSIQPQAPAPAASAA